MKTIKLRDLIWMSLFVLSTYAEAKSSPKEEYLKEFLIEYQKGSYSQGLEILNQAPRSEQKTAALHYWKGVSLAKLQKYKASALELAEAVKLDKKAEFEDAPYLLGQSYYATEYFTKAKAAFQTSIDRNYKLAPSMYYLGYLQNLTNEDKKAEATLIKVSELPAPNDEMKQAAQFQLGEVYYERAQKMSAKTDEDKAKQKEHLKSLAIPTYEKAIATDANGALAIQSTGRIAEIRQRFSIPLVESVVAKTEVKTEEKKEIPHTKSGAVIPVHPWVLRVSEDVKYDSNLTNQADGKLNAVSYTGAALSKTGVFTKYEKIFKNWFVVTPELSADITLHNNRIDPTVFSNDTATVAPAVRGRLDHMLFGNSAAALPEYEFNYVTRDYHNLHSQDYYTKYSNIILGERFKYFSTGETTVKFSYKFAYNNVALKNYLAPKIYLSQNWTIKTYILNTSFAYESQAANDIISDQKSYTSSNSFGVPNLIWTTNVDFSLTLTATDTMNQATTRGTEMTYSPGVTFTKQIDKDGKFSMNLNYTFTRNVSDDKKSYDYIKHVIGLGGSFTF